MRSRAYDEALAILDEQLAQTPERIGILVERAAALGLSGKHSEALAIYEDVCARYPGDGTAWYQRGVALSELGRLTDAIDFYRRALVIDPLDASTNFNQGCLLVQTGTIPDARCSIPNVAPTSRHCLMPDSKGHPHSRELGSTEPLASPTGGPLRRVA